jgi:hypothetical protein
MNSDARLYHAIFTGQQVVDSPPSATGVVRQPGAIATIVRVFNGLEYGRLSIHVMTRDEQGICLRSPIGLIPGAIYRLSLGSDPDHSTLVHVTAFRARGDGTYDVGAREITERDRSRAAA